MKKPIVIVIAGLLITSCAYAQKNKKIDPKIQRLIDRTLKNMVFVKGGSFMMGERANRGTYRKHRKRNLLGYGENGPFSIDHPNGKNHIHPYRLELNFSSPLRIAP
jgi:hypothetical protein